LNFGASRSSTDLPASFDLQEQRRAIAAHVQPDGAESANATDTDHLEGDVLERVSIDQTKPVGRQTAFINAERVLGVDVVAGVTLGPEMIDERRPVVDARLLAHYQTGEVVVLREVVARLCEDAPQLALEHGILDELDLARELDPAVPDF
jgi:hypothetical protein